jgi:hypothetical protein
MAPDMGIHRLERAADSPLVHRVSLVRYDADTADVTTPDGCWDIVVIGRQGGARTLVLQTGLITRPVALDWRAGDSYLCISFKPGVYMPALPGSRTVDRGRLWPLVGPRQFALQAERLEIPTFDNAEGMVDRLRRRGLITRDELVEGVVEGRPRAASPRALQRHFQQATGVTAKRLAQIFRAGRAVELLRQGRPPVDVALATGYADQPHLTRSLKAIMGRTPRQIARMGAFVQEDDGEPVEC